MKRQSKGKKAREFADIEAYASEILSAVDVTGLNTGKVNQPSMEESATIELRDEAEVLLAEKSEGRRNGD